MSNQNQIDEAKAKEDLEIVFKEAEDMALMMVNHLGERMKGKTIKNYHAIAIGFAAAFYQASTALGASGVEEPEEHTAAFISEFLPLTARVWKEYRLQNKQSSIDSSSPKNA